MGIAWIGGGVWGYRGLGWGWGGKDWRVKFGGRDWGCGD